MARLFPLRTRFQRDVGEIENYFETYSRRHRGRGLHDAPLPAGDRPGLDTQITRYLSQPVCPTFLGFDPRIQLVHERRRARGARRRGAQPGARRRERGRAGHDRPDPDDPAGRQARAADRRTAVRRGHVAPASRLGLDTQSDDFQRLLRYGRGVDIAQAHATRSGYTPRHSTVDAVESWAAARERRPREPGARAIAFMRRLREPARLRARASRGDHRGAAALPRDARETVERDRCDRLDGDYSEDEWGFDEDFAELVEPFFAFLYERWWRVKVEGAERVPAHGRVAAHLQPRRASCPGTPR